MTKPQPFFAEVRKGLILGLCAQQGHGGLFAGLPGDSTVSNALGVSQCGAPVIAVFGPVGIGEARAGEITTQTKF